MSDAAAGSAGALSPAATASRGLDAAAVLEQLLRIPSPTGATQAIAAALVEISRAAGFSPRIDAAGNVLMSWGRTEVGGVTGAGGEDIVLLGHADTVPGDLAVRRRDGRLLGRGSVDAKGPLAAALSAVSRLPRSGGRPITVIAAMDEEGPSHGARLLRERQAPAHLIILEPSGWDTVTTAYRGCVRLRLRTERHAAHPAGGETSAPDRLITTLARLRAHLATTAARAVDAVQVRVNRLSSGTDGTREWAAAHLEIRLPVGTGSESLISLALDLADGCEVEVESACDAASVERTNPTVRALARGIASQGGRPRYTTKTGTSDLNVVLPTWRCPAGVYGPGECRLDHTPHESIALDELERGALVLTATLASLREER